MMSRAGVRVSPKSITGTAGSRKKSCTGTGERQDRQDVCSRTDHVLKYECKNGREKTGRWRYYNGDGVLIMERVYTASNDLLCELYYDYDEYVRIVTLQWTKFLDDEIEKYKQRTSEFDGKRESRVSL